MVATTNAFRFPSLVSLSVLALLAGCTSGNGGDSCEPLTVDSIQPATLELWPPNHKFQTVSIHECVGVDPDCSADLTLYFTYAGSDEPPNSTGDGNTEVDIGSFGCSSVELLSERKGNGDARVYTLGYRVIDAAGEVGEGECYVVVPHDQGGKVPVDSGMAYEATAPSCE